MKYFIQYSADDYKSTEFQYHTVFTVYYFNDCVECKILEDQQSKKDYVGSILHWSIK